MLAEKIIDIGGLSTALPWPHEPGTAVAKAKEAPGATGGRNQQSHLCQWRKHGILSSYSSKSLFPLKKGVNALPLIFKSFMNSGIASLILNSEGWSMLSNQALASIEWITKILFSMVLILNIQWKTFFYHCAASCVLNNKNSYQRKHWCTKASHHLV